MSYGEVEAVSSGVALLLLGFCWWDSGALLSFSNLGTRCSVGGPGEVLCDVHPQEFCAADSLHSRAVDGQWGVVNRRVVSPEVHHNLLFLPHIEGQVVSTTPFCQLCHFLSVVHFIVVADETYHWCVIGKLDDVVGAELGSAVVGQHREEQRAEHTALWSTRT